MMGSVLRRAVLGLALMFGAALAPGLASADGIAPFLGKWDAEAQSCNPNATDSLFEVRRNEIAFYGAICAITDQRSTGVGKTLVVSVLCEGEGEPWNDDFLMVPLDNGRLVMYYGSGYGFSSAPCR